MIKYKIVFTDDITKENIFCQLFKASKFVNKIINNKRKFTKNYYKRYSRKIKEVAEKNIKYCGGYWTICGYNLNVNFNSKK